MIGTTGVALDFIYQGIARNRISLAPLSATQAVNTFFFNHRSTFQHSF
jgi:hypothetical protein